ncbi:phage tail sheath family protein [Lachnospiraceae bacterium 62-35]
MAGGTWTSTNKVLPGVYINVRSQGSTAANVGTKGVAAIAEPLSWGQAGVVQEIVPGTDLKPYIGYDITNEKALFLREMMKGSDVTHGPVKILLYRPAGIGGEKAAASIGGLTVTALYEGIRGNDISIVVQENPDLEGVYDISTIIDGAVADEQAVTSVSELKANAWVGFSGSGEFSKTAGTVLTGGVDPVVAAADYAAFLTAIEPYQFDIIVYDGTDSTTIQAIAAFVKRLSDGQGRKCQAVMSGAAAAECNSEFVIAVNNGVKMADGTVITPQQATWWLGGAEAGALYNESLTYARYPNAAEAFPKLTDAEAEAAINSGQICFMDMFGTVKVCTDINTLTSFPVDKGREFSKNRVIRVIHQFCNDVYRQFSLYYIGKADNNETGRNLLRGWIIGYLNEMQANHGIQNFTAEDVEVSAGSSVDSVMIHAALQPVDSIEKIYMTVTVSAGTTEE